MKINPLPSWEYLNECFEVDPTCLSGLRWKERPTSHGLDIEQINRKYAGEEAGRASKSGYMEVRLDGRTFRSHRLVFSIFHQVNIDNKILDHRDRNIQNNHIDNLRIVTHQQNQWNAGLSRNNTSGYKGIKKKKTKEWKVFIYRSGDGRF